MGGLWDGNEVYTVYRYPLRSSDVPDESIAINQAQVLALRGDSCFIRACSISYFRFPGSMVRPQGVKFAIEVF